MSEPKAGDGLIEDLRVRRDGWTPARQQAFLEALAELKCVRDACAMVGMSNTSAYRRKRASPAFSFASFRAEAIARPYVLPVGSGSVGLKASWLAPKPTTSA